MYTILVSRLAKTIRISAEMSATAAPNLIESSGVASEKINIAIISVE